MIWVKLLVCEILLEVFGLYDSSVGIIAIKNKFDMKKITGIVLHYNYIIIMVDCALKVTVAIWLLTGPDESSCYSWAMVFGVTGKSLSEAFILTSTNPQYDNRLFIDLPVQYIKTTSSEHGENILCTRIVFVLTFRTIYAKKINSNFK